MFDKRSYFPYVHSLVIGMKATSVIPFLKYLNQHLKRIGVMSIYSNSRLQCAPSVNPRPVNL
jgi:ribonucleotide reductase beta subunit family protein with ferritin-like domain